MTAEPREISNVNSWFNMKRRKLFYCSSWHLLIKNLKRSWVTEGNVGGSKHNFGEEIKSEIHKKALVDKIINLTLML
jgi:hypothetical protein